MSVVDCHTVQNRVCVQVLYVKCHLKAVNSSEWKVKEEKMILDGGDKVAVSWRIRGRRPSLWGLRGCWQSRCGCLGRKRGERMLVEDERVRPQTGWAWLTNLSIVVS